MRKLSRKHSLLLLFIFCCGSLGCSASSAVQTLGSNILQYAGVLPGKSVFDASESLVKATEAMTREEEYYLGRAVAARILTLYQLDSRAELQKYLNKVGLTVVAYSDQAETFGGYHFALLDSAEVNALAAPGGFIFITRGLLEGISDEDTLASVLAHEVAHVAKRHGVQAISQSNLTDVLLAAGQMAGSLNCAEVLQQATTVFGGAVEDIVGTLVEKGYSRDQEREADALAVDYMWYAGYDPHALAVMLEQLEFLTADKESGWLKSHPGIKQRKLGVAEKLEELSIEADQAGRESRAARFQQVLR